ncbi:hypothetical protein KSS87_010450 [Heliosperma pusillum]|nr:hypothetical protein KSS87_010450 [Heliosperma pusillum]
MVTEYIILHQFGRLRSRKRKTNNYGSNSKIYVAVGKEMEERRSTLKWVLEKARGRNISIIHVHVPAQLIPFSVSLQNADGSEVPVSSIRDTEIEEFRERERQELLKILDDNVCLISGTPLLCAW